MLRHLHRAAVLLAIAVAGVAVSACGKEEEALLDRAFKQEIRSATLSLRFEAGDGVFTMRGPVLDNGGGAFPSVDLRMRAESATGPGVALRVISSPRNMFVKYGGETYEVGEREVARMAHELAAGGDEQIEDVDEARRLGLRLERWFPQSDVEEESRVGDVATTRVTGELDVSAMLEDLRRLASNPALADPSLERLRRLGPREIERIDELVSDPRFAVDVADEDGALRRIAATMSVREHPGGPGRPLRFTLTLSDVNEFVAIDPPESGRPIRELLERLSEGVTQS